MTDPTAGHQVLVEQLLGAEPGTWGPVLAALDNDALVAVLAATADDLDAIQARLDAGYALRLAIFQAGRDREHRVTQRRLAEAARVSEPAVIQALRKSAQAQRVADLEQAVLDARS